MGTVPGLPETVPSLLETVPGLLETVPGLGASQVDGHVTDDA